jgi:hypothetical protein
MTIGVCYQVWRLKTLQSELRDRLWCWTAEGSDEYRIPRIEWKGDYDDNYQVRCLWWLRFYLVNRLEDSLNPEPIQIRTVTHIVASWRLTQLRLRAVLPYLTLCAQRSLLRSAVDQLDRLARADYCENFLEGK